MYPSLVHDELGEVSSHLAPLVLNTVRDDDLLMDEVQTSVVEDQGEKTPLVFEEPVLNCSESPVLTAPLPPSCPEAAATSPMRDRDKDA